MEQPAGRDGVQRPGRVADRGGPSGPGAGSGPDTSGVLQAEPRQRGPALRDQGPDAGAAGQAVRADPGAGQEPGVARLVPSPVRDDGPQPGGSPNPVPGAAGAEEVDADLSQEGGDDLCHPLTGSPTRSLQGRCT